jgi:hypothetical protein
MSLQLHSGGVLQGRADHAGTQRFSGGQARGSQGHGPGFPGESDQQGWELSARDTDAEIIDLDEFDDFKQPTRPHGRLSGQGGERHRQSGASSQSRSGKVRERVFSTLRPRNLECVNGDCKVLLFVFCNQAHSLHLLPVSHMLCVVRCWHIGASPVAGDRCKPYSRGSSALKRLLSQSQSPGVAIFHSSGLIQVLLVCTVSAKQRECDSR